MVGAQRLAQDRQAGIAIADLEVAQHLIRLEGRPISIEYTGLREGEKLHEELFGRHEPRDLRPWHASVSHVPVTPLDLRRLEELPHDGPRAFLLDALVGACDEDRTCENTQDWTELLSRPGDLRDTVGHYDD